MNNVPNVNSLESNRKQILIDVVCGCIDDSPH